VTGVRCLPRLVLVLSWRLSFVARVRIVHAQFSGERHRDEAWTTRRLMPQTEGQAGDGILALIAGFETAIRRDRQMEGDSVPRPKAGPAAGRSW
jgi:hypothetical protein